MDPRIQAATLLGRWTLIGQRHGQGCSCCPPGLGEVAMEEVEQRVLAWLRGRHPSLQEGLADFLKRSISHCADGKEALFQDIAEALDDLERMQTGLPW